MPKPIYNHNVMVRLHRWGYKTRHIAIVMCCSEDAVKNVLKRENEIEPSLKFMTYEQKQRLYALDKILRRKPDKWGSNEFYYITILKFLQVPHDKVMEMYKSAPQNYVAQAYKKRIPQFKKFDFTSAGLNTGEYESFVEGCYYVIHDVTKWQ